MIIERKHSMLLTMWHHNRPASLEQLKEYLQDPERVLADLLKSKKLKPGGLGKFRYTPRPIEVAGYRISPRVKLQSEWNAPNLNIKLVSYRLNGLEAIQDKVSYGFNASFCALPGELAIRAEASLAIMEGMGGIFLPTPVVAALGNRVLSLVLDRLQNHCSRNLPTAFAAWWH